VSGKLKSLSTLIFRKRSPKEIRLLALNSICNSLIKYTEKQLKYKFLDEQYKGLIFYCNKELFTRYVTDFKEVLESIGFLAVAQSIPEAEDVYDYLKLRLKEHLPKEIERSRSRGLKGGADAKIFNVEGHIDDSRKEVRERAETLIGLIENHLELRDLMLIIINADELDHPNLKRTINDVFAAGFNSNHKAALTLVLSSVSSPNDTFQVGNWFVFKPQQVVTEKDLVDFVWTNLALEQQELFGNTDILKRSLMKSGGSCGILREKWNEIWEEYSV
jgi:hypothetical protein